MKFVEPQVYLIGETCLLNQELELFLNEIDASSWTTDAPSDGELILEVMGRLCYKSFMPRLNPNITKVRRGNEKYLRNIVEAGHGSVLEHATANFIFHNVSRVFTHELVRHRVGVAISQESLRFVRLDNFRFWIPEIVKRHPRREDWIKIIVETVEFLENQQRRMSELLAFEDPEKFSQYKKEMGYENESNFAVYKKLTSAMRRIAPIGLATSIGWSVNFRTLRHVIEMRTDVAAEEEIRLVFGKVAEKVVKRYPHLFGDYEVREVDGLPHYITNHRKV